MAKEVAARPQGIYSDAAAASAPPGSMRTAQDVVMRRAGVVEPRPVLVSAQGHPDMIGNYQDKLIVLKVRPDTPVVNYKILTVSGNNVTTVGGTTYNTTAKALEYEGPDGVRNRSAEARGSFYFTTASGVKKVEAATAVPKVAGLPQPAAPIITTGATGSTEWTFRTCYVRVDANDQKLRSAPSPLVLSPPCSQAEIKQHLSSLIVTGDRLEVYRSLPDVTNDELQLAAVFEILATHVGLGYVSSDVYTPIGALGGSLYTNATQEGILQRNSPPPVCSDLALYQGSMFFANVRAYEAFISLDATVSSAGVVRPGYRRFSASWHFNNGSAAVTADVGNGFTLQKGMAVKSPALTASYAVIGSLYTSSTKDRITLNVNATLTDTTAATFYDFFRVGNEYFYAYITPGFDPDLYEGTTQGKYMAALANAININSTAYTAEIAYTQGAADVQVAGLFVRSRNTIVATTVSWSPQAKGVNYVGNQPGVAWSGDDRLLDVGSPNALAWSKPEQPEAVPEVNGLLVGAANYPILRIVPTRDALYVFKQDGTWVLTGPVGGGSFPAQWRVDLLDPTLSLLTPDCVAVIGDTIYGWFTRGFLAIQRGGVTDLGFGKIDDQLASLQLFLAQKPTREHVGGVWVAAGEYDREIYLSDGTKVYVYNTESQAWTTWTGTYVAADEYRRLGGVVFAGNDTIHYQDSSGGARITASSVSAVVEFRGSSLQDPAAKSRFVDCQFLFDNADAATSVTLSMTSSEDDSAATANETFTARVSDNGRAVRFRVPRNHSRASVVYPKVTIPGGDWRLTGFALTGYPYSRRTTR